MNNANINKNQVFLTGEIITGLKLIYKNNGNNFYKTELAVKRNSGIMDYIPLFIPEKLIENEDDYCVGTSICVSGEYRSYNRKNKNGRMSLHLMVYVKYIENNDMEYEDNNKIILDGYICKEPIFRTTPLNKEITDVLLAVNTNKSSYIPCIFWYDDARNISEFVVGTHIKIYGRIQSREYIKKLSDTEIETRIAYEVSVYKFELLS